MARPEVKMITLSIDGREVTAPEGAMLVDGAKYGDVEIPVFCYEPKLGNPVGACRMCLVEVEGIPKLQTACSTPIKDGMVVHTQTARVHEAQRSVVEFLLINHPLDCPVCDKGGECPLQDVSYGWGGGTSRFIEPKRHFKKPLELSPLIAIDRERCILCYRCVRFSQEISEDYQLILLERGAHSYVGTFDGHPYVGPFSGNIIQLCPVGALTSKAYRFRARPWDSEGAASVCTLCPAQCNIEFTVRDERVMRVTSRDNVEVDDGWLCDKGRFAYQHVHADERLTHPWVREGERLMPATWEKALSVASSALDKAGRKSAAIAGGETSNEEAFLLQRLFREGLGSSALSATIGGREALPLDLTRALADPRLGATVSDLEFADTVLLLDVDPIDDAPILDLRIRKGVRRRGVKLAVASERPTALDPSADRILRYAPGAGEAMLVALDAALGGDEGVLSGGAASAGAHAGGIRDLASLVSGDNEDAGGQSGQARDADTRTTSGGDVVVVYSERLLESAGAARALLNLAARLGLSGREGAGLIEIPSSTNGRGLREAGFAPGHGPGYETLAEPGAPAGRIVDELADGTRSTLLLWHADPLRTHPDRRAWETALAAAQTVIAYESVMTDTVREHADVVFPAEAYAEKEGTLVHPDGRLQRLRVAIGRPKGQDGRSGSGVRAGHGVVAELSRAIGLDLRVLAGPMASQQLFDAVPFYAGLSLDEIGGQGVRWPARAAAAAAVPDAEWALAPLDPPRPAQQSADGTLRLGTFRSLWTSKEVEASPALQFMRPKPVVEIAPADAERLGVTPGDEVELGTNGTRVRAAVALRAAIPAGSVFMAEGTRTQPSNVLTDRLVEVRPIHAGAVSAKAGAQPIVQTPAGGDGFAEMGQSAPLESPPGTTFGSQTEDGGTP